MIVIAKSVKDESQGVPWFWITGDTYEYRETLKAAGARWSAKRVAWYYTGAALPGTIADLGTITGVVSADTRHEPKAAPAAKSTLPEKLRKLGDGLAATIERLSTEAFAGQASTRLRENFRESRRQDRRNAELLQVKLYALAEAHEAGTIPPVLAQLRNKELIRMVASGYDFPQPRLHYPKISEIERRTHGKKGVKDHAAVLDALRRRIEHEYAPIYGLEEAEHLKALVKLAAPGKYEMLEPGGLADYIEAIKTGVGTPDLWASAVQAMTTLGDPAAGKESIADRIRREEAELCLADLPGFFPTPRDVVLEMCQYLDLPYGASVLEPSAGKGNIAEVLRDVYAAKVRCIEWYQCLRTLLILKGFEVIHSDFLAYYQPEDYIVQNPPFEHGQDIDHVRHAYGLLRAGGTLVSLMSTSPFFNEQNKAKEFRAWFESVGGQQYEVDDGAFKTAERPTGVSVCIVVIHKKEAAV